MHLHYRPSVADGIEESIPDLLAGGDNPLQQDGCKGYPSNTPDKQYVEPA